MKIRTDFVSNSSSSSFVFSANFKKYPFDEFVKSVCSACDDGENDNKLYSENEAILKYCMQYFELLHLGTLVIGRKKTVVRRGYGINGEKITDPEELKYSEFNLIKQEFIDSKPKYNPENGSARMVSDDEIEYEYDDEASGSLTVLRGQMENIRNTCSWAYDHKPSDTERRSARIKEMMKIIKCVKADANGAWHSPYCSSTYLITKNTIANTRDLIAAGYTVKLEKWESLDALEARLSAGETLFHIECGDAGEGQEDTRVFSNGGQYPFENIPLESIESEF